MIKVTKRCGIHADTDAVFLHLVQTDPVMFRLAITTFTLKCSNSKLLQVVIPTEPMKGCVTLLASLRPASFASWVFWALLDDSHLCSFCFLPSVTARQRTAGPPWGLPAIRLCHLCPGVSRVDIWPLPWRRWSTSGRSTVNTSLPLFPKSALHWPLDNCLCLTLKIQSTSHQPPGAPFTRCGWHVTHAMCFCGECHIGD